MDSNALYATLPDLSARIMRNALVSESKVDWDEFCRNSHVRPVRFDEQARDLLAQEEMLLQKAFADCTANARNIWFDVGLRYRAIKYGELGLAMMFTGTYSTDFYRLVRDLIHAEVDAEQSALREQAAAYRSAKQSIQARWDELIALERDYRLEATGQSAIAATSGSGLAAGIA